MDKKELALEVIRRLKKEYPLAACTLDYRDAWQLLVSVRLAAQCTDKRVDMVTPKLYEKFPSVRALAEADVRDIEEIVRPCGLGPSKARDISRCMKVLHEKYHDQVPDDFQELRAGQSRKGAVENHSAGGRQRSLPSFCLSRQGSLHRPSSPL